MTVASGDEVLRYAQDDKGPKGPLSDLTFWLEHPMSEGFRDTSRDVRSHNPCHSSDRQAAISA
jgi:hypothetical protein